MTDKHNITRRALLAGAGATLSSAALGASALASTSLKSVETAPVFNLQAWLDDQTPAQRANYHQTQLAMAMCELSPGKWRTACTANQDFVIVVRDAQTAPADASVFVQYLY